MCSTGRVRAERDGYIPHNDCCFTCPQCGWDTFETYPQGVSTDAKVWGYEQKCERCGKITTMYVKRS